MSWYVIREIPKPPYEVTWSEHATEEAAYEACPDAPDFEVWSRPASPGRHDDRELSSQGSVDDE